MVPGSFECLPTFHADVKNQDGTSRFSRQHHWPRLGHVPRSAWPIDGERAIEPFFQPPRHYGQSTQSPARRTSLRRPESQPLNHFACPLPVECRRIHHHHAVIPVPPHNRNDDPVPERPDTLFLCRIHTLLMMPTQHFITKRAPAHSSHPVDPRADVAN